jgi:hypothetical protein
MDPTLALLKAERDITRVIMTYSRAADRCDLELMRECYWPDGTDHHGSFVGGRDDFIEFVRASLQRFERTNHFLGNILVDVDLDVGTARAETYCVAYHRYTDAENQLTDMTAGLRYIDTFERRGDEWRILRRVVAYEWRRTDPALGSTGFADAYITGVRSLADAVYAEDSA